MRCNYRSENLWAREGDDAVLTIVGRRSDFRVLVSIESAPLLMAFHWTVAWDYDGLVYFGDQSPGVRADFGKRLMLHRAVLGVPDGLVVDHIDGNTLNNRIANLRAVPQAVNARNRSAAANHNSRSGARGVTWDKARKKWWARGQVGKRAISLGRFGDLEQARAAAHAFRVDHGQVRP